MHSEIGLISYSICRMKTHFHSCYLFTRALNPLFKGSGEGEQIHYNGMLPSFLLTISTKNYLYFQNVVELKIEQNLIHYTYKK